jgi:hypothetical protein
MTISLAYLLLINIHTVLGYTKNPKPRCLQKWKTLSVGNITHRVKMASIYQILSICQEM